MVYQVFVREALLLSSAWRTLHALRMNFKRLDGRSHETVWVALAG
jgi:hypothetical protein